MGMYTELILKCQLKRDLPSSVKNVINGLVEGWEEIENPPEHEFFKCERWQRLFSMNSFYHHPESFADYQQGYLFVRSDLKNYDGEIEKFIEWIKPYVDFADGKTCIGWKWYEEDEKPTLILA